MYVGLQGGYGVAKGRKRVDVEGEVEVARPRGSRWLASVETGWPFRLGGFARGLEPQPQGPVAQLNLSAEQGTRCTNPVHPLSSVA